MDGFETAFQHFWDNADPQFELWMHDHLKEAYRDAWRTALRRAAEIAYRKDPERDDIVQAIEREASNLEREGTTT